MIPFLYLNNTYERSRWEITDEVTFIEALIGRTSIVIVVANVNVVVRYHIISECG